MNKVILMGRLCADPELQVSSTDYHFTRFTVAIDRKKDEVADFIPCVAFGKLADFITAWFHKGKMISLVGRLCSDQYVNQNGEKRTNYSVVLNEAYFCGSEK